MVYGYRWFIETMNNNSRNSEYILLSKITGIRSLTLPISISLQHRINEGQMPVKTGRRRQHLPPEVVADLARSGLTERDATKMGIHIVSADSLKEIFNDDSFSRDAVAFPYHDIDGRINGFARYKPIGTAAPLDRTALKTRGAKYLQPPKSRPHVYLPPFLDWCEVVEDPSIPIIITEGEKKAACAAKLLRASTKKPAAVLGLGGVWSFGSKKEGTQIIPELEQFISPQREITIIFDSDTSSNTQVAAARGALSRVALRMNAAVYVIDLPPLSPGEKTGLDDYLITKGVKAFETLPRKPAGLSVELIALNEEVAAIDDGTYYVFANKVLASTPQRLEGTIFAPRTVIEYDPTGRARSVNLFKLWTNWPGRRTHRALVYDPGQPTVTVDGSYNVWPGWGAEPIKGNIKPFYELIDHLFTGADEYHRWWFLAWLFYPLAHPGTKLYTAAVLYSQTTGVGKSSVGLTLGSIYGDNFSEIGADDLYESFNDYAAKKQFILGDEVTGNDRPQRETERLKRMITRERLTVNQKYQAKYTLKDCTNYLFTTNHATAISLDEKDRRFFIYEITAPRASPAFYTRYDRWRRSKEGINALFYHALNEFDFTHARHGPFNPTAAAPATPIKDVFVELSGSAVGDKLRQMRDSPKTFFESVGGPPSSDLLSVEQVLTILQLDPLFKNVSRIALGREMIKVFTRLGVANLPDRSAVILYAWRNLDRWQSATHAEIVTYYVKHTDPAKHLTPEPAKVPAAKPTGAGRKKKRSS